MILKKALFYVVIAAILAAAAMVVVFAAALALYALASTKLVPAGAAAVVAGAAALLLVLTAVVATARFSFGKPEPTLAERAAEFARDKPIAALVAALGAGVVAVRSPKTVVAILAALLEPKRRRKP